MNAIRDAMRPTVTSLVISTRNHIKLLDFTRYPVKPPNASESFVNDFRAVLKTMGLSVGKTTGAVKGQVVEILADNVNTVSARKEFNEVFLRATATAELAARHDDGMDIIATAHPSDAGHDLLQALKNIVSKATTDYCGHSKSIRVSFFHYHGKTGRERAEAFAREFSQCPSLQDAADLLGNYLSNNKNGNTQPHSYRTMLLHALITSDAVMPSAEEGTRSRLQLHDLSKNFKTKRAEFLDVLTEKIELMTNREQETQFPGPRP